ncbi:hypothetical protein CYCD_12170 [Tenuifilaceae bacterium CYCD]|nr:hypothetical protein CYCD_12170 [Tenuifilaceae bacterium CYCD]
MNRRLLYVLLVFVVAEIVTSCKSCKKDPDDISQELFVPDSIASKESVPVLGKPVIDEMMQNIASPVETAALIKGLKIPFNKDFLVNTKSAEKFNTSFEKALALGIYSCDLGYLNMYEKTSFVVDYISIIKRLADDIQVGQFFDFSTLKRLATNNENLDSLVTISQQSFSRIDNYLRETNRSMLSVVIVAGVWVEGAYLTTRVAQISDHKRIRETLGEQKTILGFLLPILKVYEKDPNMAKFLTDINKIKVLFDNVKITYEIGEPEMVEVNGEVTFVQHDKQVVEMSEETYKQIIESVQKLRSDLTKL